MYTRPCSGEADSKDAKSVLLAHLASIAENKHIGDYLQEKWGERMSEFEQACGLNALLPQYNQADVAMCSKLQLFIS